MRETPPPFSSRAQSTPNLQIQNQKMKDFRFSPLFSHKIDLLPVLA